MTSGAGPETSTKAGSPTPSLFSIFAASVTVGPRRITTITHGAGNVFPIIFSIVIFSYIYFFLMLMSCSSSPVVFPASSYLLRMYLTPLIVYRKRT